MPDVIDEVNGNVDKELEVVGADDDAVAWAVFNSLIRSGRFLGTRRLRLGTSDSCRYCLYSLSRTASLSLSTCEFCLLADAS